MELQVFEVQVCESLNQRPRNGIFGKIPQTIVSVISQLFQGAPNGM